jgi:SlyX protein
MSEHRFEELEMKLSFQEDIIHKLDDALANQQQQIIDLQRQVQLLGNEMRSLDVQISGDSRPEPPPPHY